MKVTNEHYNLLSRHMTRVMNERGVTKQIWDEHYKGFTEQRKLWDLYAGIMASSVMFRELIVPLFYEYEDSHVETALRKFYNSLS